MKAAKKSSASKLTSPSFPLLIKEREVLKFLSFIRRGFR